MISDYEAVAKKFKQYMQGFESDVAMKKLEDFVDGDCVEVEGTLASRMSLTVRGDVVFWNDDGMVKRLSSSDLRGEVSA